MKKISWKIAFAITLAGILTSVLAASSPAYFIIPTTGHIKFSVTAQSGSVADIQAAVDQAIRIRAINIIIPRGYFTFNASGDYRVNINVPTSGLNISGAGINLTVLDMPDDDLRSNSTIMFRIVGSSGGKIRISGITFKGRANTYTGDIGINLESSCKDFRIDHCSFHDMGGAGIGVNDHNALYGTGGDWNKVSQGVIDHCEFYTIYKQAAYYANNGYGYGVGVVRAYNTMDCPWENDISTLLGTYGHNVFVEDCTFSGCRHVICAFAGGAIVFRHNVILNHATENVVDQHPPRIEVYGGRCEEVYDNILNAYLPNWKFGIYFAGGGGVIFNNTIDGGGIYYAFMLGDTDATSQAIWDVAKTHDVWIWNNTYDCPVMLSTSGPPPGIVGNPPTENVDYFLYAKSGYTPYVYPHPLTLESSP